MWKFPWSPSSKYYAIPCPVGVVMVVNSSRVGARTCDPDQTHRQFLLPPWIGNEKRRKKKSGRRKESVVAQHFERTRTIVPKIKSFFRLLFVHFLLIRRFFFRLHQQTMCKRLKKNPSKKAEDHSLIFQKIILGNWLLGCN